MSSIVDFENILLEKKNLEITNIRVKDYIVLFNMNGHEFATQGSHIYHSSHPLYIHPLTKMWAAESNDPMEILRKDIVNAQINSEIDMFIDNKFEIYKTVFTKALEILERNDQKAFIKHIESHFFITVEGKGKKLLKKLDHERTRRSKRQAAR